jgi:hypothetical protein
MGLTTSIRGQDKKRKVPLMMLFLDVVITNGSARKADFLPEYFL